MSDNGNHRWVMCNICMGDIFSPPELLAADWMVDWLGNTFGWRDVANAYPIVTIPCGHGFHSLCLAKWEERCNAARRSCNCPMCHRNVSEVMRMYLSDQPVPRAPEPPASDREANVLVYDQQKKIQELEAKVLRQQQDKIKLQADLDAMKKKELAYQTTIAEMKGAMKTKDHHVDLIRKFQAEYPRNPGLPCPLSLYGLKVTVRPKSEKPTEDEEDIVILEEKTEGNSARPRPRARAQKRQRLA